MDNSALWALAEDTMNAFVPHYKMAMRAVIKDADIQHGWAALFLARGHLHDGIHPDQLAQCFPKTAPGQHRQQCEFLTRTGYLEPDGDHYLISRAGIKAIERVIRIVHRELGKLKIENYAQMKRLAQIFGYLVEESLRSPEPAERFNFLGGRWPDMGLYAPAATAIEQYITDLRRFRDDCHLAAWSDLGIEGHAWESFKAIRRRQFKTTHELKQALQEGEFPAHTAATVLEDLQRRGWIAVQGSRLSVTDAGLFVYERVMQQTEHLFFAPWRGLTAAERAELGVLLRHLHEGLQPKTRTRRAGSGIAAYASVQKTI